MVSNRTRISLCQYLEVYEPDFLEVLLEKHGFPTESIRSHRIMAKSALWEFAPSLLEDLRRVLSDGSEEQLFGLLEEAIRMRSNARRHVTSKSTERYRRDDLVLCLRMDGYAVQDKRLVPIEPTIVESTSSEGDLARELLTSGLPQAKDVVSLIDESARALREAPPRYNSCLSAARVALETCAKDIAMSLGSRDQASWGTVLSHLRQTSFITEEEEAGLSGIYKALSTGPHRPMEPVETDAVIVWRGIGVLACYILVRRYRSKTCGDPATRR